MDSLNSDVIRSAPGQDVEAFNVLKILYVISDQRISETPAMCGDHLVSVLTADSLCLCQYITEVLSGRYIKCKDRNSCQHSVYLFTVFDRISTIHNAVFEF